MLKNLNQSSTLLIAVLTLILTLTFTAGLEATSLEEIKEEGEISFAMTGEYPPFNFVDGDGVDGFDVDVAREIADRLGVEPVFETTAWDGIIAGLRAEHYDTILGSMAITPGRRDTVNFTIPYYFSGAQLVTREDSDINQVEDIAGHTVGVVTGTTFEEDARELDADLNLYEGDNETIMELTNGRVEGVITDRVVAIEFMNEGFDIELTGDLLRQETMAVAVNEDADDLLVELNLILFEMHQDGTLQEISEEWFNEDITQM